MSSIAASLSETKRGFSRDFSREFLVWSPYILPKSFKFRDGMFKNFLPYCWASDTRIEFVPLLVFERYGIRSSAAVDITFPDMIQKAYVSSLIPEPQIVAEVCIYFLEVEFNRAVV